MQWGVGLGGFYAFEADWLMARQRAADTDARGTECLAAALAYLARGWSVIPVEPRGKRPLVPWLEFQQRCAGETEVQQWFRARKNSNVAIVTGAVSGPRAGSSPRRLSVTAAPEFLGQKANAAITISPAASRAMISFRCRWSFRL